MSKKQYQHMRNLLALRHLKGGGKCHLTLSSDALQMQVGAGHKKEPLGLQEGALAELHAALNGRKERLPLFPQKAPSERRPEGHNVIPGQ